MRGQTSIEYLLIIGGVLLVALIVGAYLTDAASKIYNTVTGVSGAELKVSPSPDKVAYWVDNETLGSAGFLKVGSSSLTVTSPAELVVQNRLTAGEICLPDGCVGQWSSVGGGGGSSLWKQNGSDIYYTGGNVGIGTSTPTSPLEVNVDKEPGLVVSSYLPHGTIPPTIRLNDGTTNEWFQIRFSRITGRLYIESNSTPRAVALTKGGSLGVGVPVPRARLEM